MAREAAKKKAARKKGAAAKKAAAPAAPQKKMAASSRKAPLRKMAAVAPRPSKDELRERVEKLERANANLRAKNRELSRSERADAERIAELEAELAALRRRLAGRRPNRREIDPGDAVPEGVAVETPDPPDETARRVRADLEQHLGPGEDEDDNPGEEYQAAVDGEDSEEEDEENDDDDDEEEDEEEDEDDEDEEDDGDEIEGAEED